MNENTRFMTTTIWLLLISKIIYSKNLDIGKGIWYYKQHESRGSGRCRQVNNVYIIWNVINKTCYLTKVIMNQDELIRFVNAFSILQFCSAWKYAKYHLSLCILIQETTQI